MRLNPMIGTALLVLAAMLIYLGYPASQGIGDQRNESLTGRFSDATTGYFTRDVAAALGGFSMIIRHRISVANRPRSRQ